MNATNAMLCWNPGTDQVALVPWPDHTRLSSRYRMSTLACCAHFDGKSFEQRKCLVYITAMHLVVRDGVDPQAVHRALLELDEYRDGCANDMRGAEAARERYGEESPADIPE